MSDQFILGSSLVDEIGPLNVPVGLNDNAELGDCNQRQAVRQQVKEIQETVVKVIGKLGSVKKQSSIKEETNALLGIKSKLNEHHQRQVSQLKASHSLLLAEVEGILGGIELE